jgi:ABC-type Mn2+/Zn2+ transport system ATPase subunit
VIAAVHDLALARTHFSHALLLDTRLVAAGPAAETLSDANIDLAYHRRMPVLGVRP